MFCDKFELSNLIQPEEEQKRNKYAPEFGFIFNDQTIHRNYDDFIFQKLVDSLDQKYPPFELDENDFYERTNCFGNVQRIFLENIKIRRN